MDWGLCRTKQEGKYALREKLYYRREFYYYAIVSDLILRCTWTITAFLDVNGYPWLTSIGYGTLIGVLELFRRWQWSLIRVENEQVNNIEKYRNTLDIPDATDYLEDKEYYKRKQEKDDLMLKQIREKLVSEESQKLTSWGEISRQ